LISPSNQKKFARNGSPAVPLQPHVNVSGLMTHDDIGDGMKRSTQAAFSCRFDNLGRLL